jgi:hypothetical protein
MLRRDVFAASELVAGAAPPWRGAAFIFSQSPFFGKIHFRFFAALTPIPASERQVRRAVRSATRVSKDPYFVLIETSPHCVVPAESQRFR